jgi:hypothetical protein
MAVAPGEFNAKVASLVSLYKIGAIYDEQGTQVGTSY